MLGKVLNKPVVEVSEPKEKLYSFLIGWGRPFHYTCNFHGIHLRLSMGDDKSEVLNLGLSELALVMSEIKFVLPAALSVKCTD